MADVIDDLEIRISSSSKNAEASIDRLVRRLDSLATSINNVQSHGITKLASSVNQLSYSMKLMDSIDTRSFTRLAKNISKLSTTNNAGLFTLSTGLNRLITSLNSMATVSQNAQNVGVLANNISKLGYKKVTDAVANLPKLTTELNNLLVTLSKAPKVSSNVIQMTNALANLATQGSKVGTASTSLVRGLNRYSTASNRASKSTFSLATAFGKFYASYFLIIRGLKGVWSSIESTADYIEAYNYYNVAFGKIASDWEEDWQKYGYENGNAYAQSFTDRMNDVMSKLSGVQIDLDTGLLSETGMKNLGMNIQEVTQFASQLASVTNSVGQVGEVSLATAESITRLAGDISSLFNVDFKDVATNLQSGLIGQSRALYKYGIDITQATLQTYAFGLGLEKSVSEMTQAEKMQLRLIAILDQSKVSWGDLANTIQSPSNQIRQLSNNIAELGNVFGQLFIPMLSKVLPYVNGLTIALKRLFVNLAGFMGIDIDLDAFGQGYNDSLDDTADGFEDVADSIEKTNKALRGFDELKTISSKDTVSLGGVDETGNTIDLTDEIKKASEEYQRVWNEAFSNMENKANDLADTISKAFSFDEIASGVSEFLDTVEKFSDVISPFAKGFGEGFLGFFGTLADTSLEIFVDGVESLSKALGLVPEDVMRDVGEALGILVGTVSTLAGISGISKAFSALSGGLGAVGTALTAHPILSTFTIGAGLLTLIELLFPSVKTEKSGVATEIAEGITAIQNALSGYESEYNSTSLANEVQTIYDKWSELAYKTEELTDSEKGLLKLYGDKLKEVCKEVIPFIDDNGKAFVGVRDEIEKAVESAKLYYKTLATESYLQELVGAELRYEISLNDTKEEIDSLYKEIRKYNKKLTDEEIKGLIDIANNANFRKNFLGAMTGGTDGTAEIFAYQLGISTKDVETFEAMVDSLRHLGELQQTEKDLYDALEDNSEKISEVVKKYQEYKSVAELASESTDKMGSVIQETGDILGNMSSEFLPEVIKRVKEMKEESDNADGSVSVLGDEFNNLSETSDNTTNNLWLFNDVLKETAFNAMNLYERLMDVSNVDFSSLSGSFTGKNYTPIDTSKFDSSWKSNLPKIPLPVASSEVMQEAVSKGFENALKNGSVEVGVKVEIEPNENGIVNTVIKGINQRTKATGKTPIALAY